MITPEDQERLWRLAELAESDTPLPTEGVFTHHRGAEAAAAHSRDLKLLLEEAAVMLDQMRGTTTPPAS